MQYLHRVRFLGAFRSLRAGRAPPPVEFDSWPLSDPAVSHSSWLRATALKYRGALFAAVGEPDQALKDFGRSWALLDREGQPLIRFIGATAALEAGERLWTVRRKEAEIFLRRARDSFEAFSSYFRESGWVDQWVQRCEGFLSGKRTSRLPDPQHAFVY
jgi:hypothetical protein